MAIWTNLTSLIGLTDRTSSDSNSSSDYNLVKNSIKELAGNGASVPDKTVQENADDIAALQASTTALNVLNKTSDYTILDSDLSSYGTLLIFVNPSSGNIIITLPTLADNQNKRVVIQVSDLGGKVTLDGEGSETIGGYTSLYMQSKNNYIEVIGESGEWQILDYNITLDTGWINTNDWTERQLGNKNVAYDNLSGTFIEGEIVTEATSGNTGIIMSDSGTVLILKNITGTGIFTDGYQLTGSTSGATALVNEITSTKNQDTEVYHEFGVSITKINKKFLVSEDKTEANTYETLHDAGFTGKYGLACKGIDTDSYSNVTGINGFIIHETTGGGGDFRLLDNEDWYYKQILEVRL